MKILRTLLPVSIAAALGLAVGLAPAEAKADVSIVSHVNVDLVADPGGLYFSGTPSVRISDPSRVVVSIVDGDNTYARVVGVPVMYVGGYYRPVYYWRSHRHYRPYYVNYYVPSPVWVVRPQAVYVAPIRRPVLYVDRPRVSFARPGVVIAPRGGFVGARPGVAAVGGGAVGVRPGVVVAGGGAVRPGSPQPMVHSPAHPQPAARPGPAAAPQPAARPAPQPAARPAPQPAARPAPQPAARPAPQPAARPAPAPAARPAPAGGGGRRR